jgi:hypothetical protein
MVYSRPESIQSTTKRHPAVMRSVMAATREGDLLAMDFTADFNTGAYASWGPTVANRVPVHASGPYRVPNYRALTRAVLTHCVPAGAFRGFGVPQTVIAQEQMLDMLAEKIGIDPLDFRIRNALTNDTPTVTGQVMGKITVGTATAAAKTGGNTGNGTLTMDATTPVLAGAKAGIYTVRAVAASTNAATFRVEDPDGFVIGEVALGGTFAEQIKFATADGATDFVIGDGFDVTVAAGTGKYVPVSAAAVDGSQHAAAIIIEPADATSADVETAVLVGHAQIVSSQLTWPTGATSGQKTKWLADLAALGVVDFQRY